MQPDFSDSQADRNVAETAGARSLRERTVHGIGWNFASSTGGILVQLGRGVVLARLLVPEDFGLVGIASGTCFLLGVFTNLGIATALIQAKHVERNCAASAFWLQISVAALMTALACSVSPLLAQFYGDPRLAAVICWLAGGLLIHGALTVPLALMQRDLRFKEVNFMWGALRAISLVGSVSMAWTGWGYWSLVVPDVVTRLAAFPWLCWRRGWWPGLRLDWQPLRPMLRLAAAAFLNRCLNTLNKNLDYVILGKFFAPQIFGLYYFAYKRSRVPAKMLGSSVNNALFPALSRRQKSPEAARRAFDEGMPLYVVAAYGAATTVMLAMPQLVPCVFGAQWSEAVPMLRWFTVWLYAQPIHVFLSAYLTSVGCLWPMTVAHSARLVLTTAGLLILSVQGAGLAVCAAWVAAVELVFSAVIVTAGFRLLQLPVRSVVRSLLPGVGLVAVLVTADFTAQAIVAESNPAVWELLLIRLGTSLLAGTTFLIIFNRGMLVRLVSLLKQMLPERRATFLRPAPVSHASKLP